MVSRIPKNWLAVMGALVGAFMAILDIQITNSSLKEIQGALGATLTESSWIATSYLVAEMIAIPLTGFFSRWLSPRRYLLWNSAGFILASLACSLSWNLESMIVFRALQGFTGGALIPMAFTLIMTLLPKEKQPVGMALFGVTATFAPSIGPSLGGWLTDTFSWHYLFYLNVLPGILVMALLAMGLDKKDRNDGELKSIDLFGMVTMALGLGALEIVLEEGSRDDWFDAEYLRWLAVISAISMVFFIWRQFTAKAPLVNLRLFGNADFTKACIAYFALGAGLFGSVYMVPLFLAQIHDYTAMQIGLVLMWVGFPQLPLFPLIPKLVKKVDPRYLVFAGFVGIAISMWMNINMTVLYDGAFLIPALLVRAMAQPFMMVPLSIIATQHIRQEDAPSASTLLNVMRNLGGAVGIAMLATLLDTRTRHYLWQVKETLVSGSQNLTDWLSHTGQLMVAQGGTSNQAYGLLMTEINKQASVMAYNDGFLLMGGLLMIAALAVLAIKPAHKVAAQAPQADATPDLEKQAA
ncbi:DHA2 family efflux MFS transporter permease subunit [Gallaecimonas xiamenensis]|uniref:EmrB/QacA subfamily drug resistance transporter n=1 Tax=Gallaecimonas xiamenensis 3-C-1 TaxID=745411 RepID=K2K6M7_9GAMM|nr:DHA2 family efflux MFS transporter permease subunit [Gallaecimonas xiamenensis]EKE73065.1 EmrB/QacA subfamily drug resistance transporter [Gallaecimonas xiamenensis 3-C-1]